MRSAYQPYLIPLFKSPPLRDSSTIRSPTDEEALIRRLKARDWPGWIALKRRVRETYGVPFVVEAPDGIHRIDSCRSPPSETGEFASRYLHMQAGQDLYFVIEHPEGLAQFDKLGTGKETVILARPSLFAEWSLRETGTAEAKDPFGKAVRQPDQRALVTHLTDLIESHRPSDWHLEPRAGICLSRLRIDGQLCLQEKLGKDRSKWLLHSLIRGCKIAEGPVRNECTGSMELRIKDGTTVSLRVSIVPSLYGEAMAIRFLYPLDPMRHQLKDLGFFPDQYRLIRSQYSLPDGLWILAGPTGCGKTTTLHTLLQESVQRNEKILTAEDPVERNIAGAQQVHIGSPPGLTYPVAMKAFLRQSPDTILIGEVRDPETAAMVIQAARTGHRVLSSLHARSPEGIVRRFEDLGQESTDLDSVVRMVILQKLVPLLCPNCRIARIMPEHTGKALSTIAADMPRRYYDAGSGCEACHRGFQGRTAVAWCSVWPAPIPWNTPFLKPACSLFLQGQISPELLFPFLPASIQPLFRFSKRKDSVKKSLNLDPICS